MESMRLKSWAGAFLGVIIMASIWGQQAHAEKIDGIVAVVDSAIIMNSDLHKKMNELGAPKNRSAEKQVLELMVEDLVIERIYKSIGLPPVNDKEAQDIADKTKTSIQTARSYIMKSTLMDMMVRSRVVVTENMIKSYYEGQPEYKGEESVRLNQILIREDRDKVQAVVEELNSGAKFEEVAKKYSDVLSAGSPDIGWIAMEDLSDEIKELIKAAKPGDVIGPIETGANRQAIYQLAEKGIAGGKALDEVREEIVGTLEKKYQQEAFDHWLNKMMSEYFIGIYI